MAGGVLGDGKSQAGNQFFRTRLNANGSLDTSFDGDGRVATPMPTGIGGSQVRALALEASNPGEVKIVATGNNTEYDSARDIAVIGTGGGARIYAGGVAFSTASGAYDYVVVQYRSDGAVDAA